MNEFNIDCVKMVRKIRDANYRITKNMTTQERIEYIRNKAKQVNESCKLLLNNK